MKKILITGINGFIGNSLRLSLIKFENKFEIWGIDKTCDFKNSFSVNLLNINDCIRISEKLPQFDIVIHTAAIAHHKIDVLETYNKNLHITKNVLKYFTDYKTHLIFLSSISVYGEDKRYFPVRVNDELRPSTYYGKSKKDCEEMILNTITNVDILRLCPVYSQEKLDDIKKRVFFPYQSYFRMEIFPSPNYSLCNHELINKSILHILSRGVKNKNIYNILDPINYKQKDISECYSNTKIIIFEKLIKPLYYFTFLINSKKGYHIRCLYWKLFKSNEYVSNFNEIKLDKSQLLINTINKKKFI